MSQISEIGEILRNEKLPDYLRTSAETAKGMIKFFTRLFKNSAESTKGITKFFYQVI